MREGVYTDTEGRKVRVQRTESGGYRLTYPDGSVTMIGGSR